MRGNLSASNAIFLVVMHFMAEAHLSTYEPLDNLNRRLQNSIWWDPRNQTKYTFIAHDPQAMEGQAWVRSATALLTYTYTLSYEKTDNALRITLVGPGISEQLFTIRHTPDELELIPTTQLQTTKLLSLGPHVLGSQDHLRFGASI